MSDAHHDEATPDEEAAALSAATTDRDAELGKLLERHRRRLLKMVHLRMDPRLKARLGASDVLLETAAQPINIFGIAKDLAFRGMGMINKKRS